jgi:hypothetical protein
VLLLVNDIRLGCPGNLSVAVIPLIPFPTMVPAQRKAVLDVSSRLHAEAKSMFILVLRLEPGFMVTPNHDYRQVSM